ncbi:MAG: IS607 family transposase [Promethearchaeati archaeon SRVP18_Atabeyarchaeia-1]
MEKSYSPREAAAILGVAVHTIQVWDRQGKIRCVRLPSGRRRVPESEVRRLLNVKEERKDAIYARVFSSNQKGELERQVSLLKELAPSAVVYTDVRSGLNFKRKGLFQLLEDLVDRKIARLFIAHEDRLARIGYELISWLCEKYGTEIIVAEKEVNPSLRQEYGKDMIALNMAFSAKLFGLRSHNTARILRAVKDAIAETRSS